MVKLVLDAIKQKFSIKLPREDAAATAMHLVSNEIPSPGTETFDKGALIECYTKAIEADGRICPQAPATWQRTAGLTGPRGSLQ